MCSLYITDNENSCFSFSSFTYIFTGFLLNLFQNGSDATFLNIDISDSPLFWDCICKIQKKFYLEMRH